MAKLHALGNEKKTVFLLHFSRFLVTLPSNDSEVTPSQQKKNEFFCSALDF